MKLKIDIYTIDYFTFLFWYYILLIIIIVFVKFKPKTQIGYRTRW